MASLEVDIIKKKKVIAIYGLGNVGGPIAAAWLRKGAKIIGVDISTKLLSQIKSGSSHQKEPFVSETLLAGMKKGTLSLTSDGIDASLNSHIKIITVPVDTVNNKINLNALISATTNIAKGLKKNDAVIISPSLPPGTTENVVLPILEKHSQLKSKGGFHLIYNPERIFEGRSLQDIEENYPAIVSGIDKKSLKFGESLLKIISKKGVLSLSSISIAEAEKLFEGVYRDVNIALANELAIFSQKIGINFWEARKGANSQPYCHLHYPGTGVGGLCIPIYPKFILESAKKIGQNMAIMESARLMNDSMPKECVKNAIQLLVKNRKNLKKPKIAILGLGFRGDVTDSRLSPTYSVVKEFLKNGYSVSIHDPFIQYDEMLPSNIPLSDKLDEVVDNASLVFISTDHKVYSKLTKKSFAKVKQPLLIFDGRNILNKNNFKNTLIRTVGMDQYSR